MPDLTFASEVVRAAATYVQGPASLADTDFAGDKRAYISLATQALEALVKVDQKPAPSETERGAAVHGAATIGRDWFEDIHIVPRSFDFGNLLSDQSTGIEVFSSFRRASETWSSFTNNAGAGVELASEPSLPATIDPLTGYNFTVDVSTSGDAFVDSTLDFIFSGVGTISVPIEIQRIVLWGLRPEMPFTENLRFLTSILRARSGQEQRVSPRSYPRRQFNYDYLLEEGVERQTLDSLLFDWQSRAFGLPVWWEETELSSAASASDLTINVVETDYRDFQVGGLAVVFTSQGTFDVLEISSLTSTSITFSSGLVNSYAAGTPVFPLVTCYARPNLRGARWPENLARLSIDWLSTSEVTDLGDTSAFSSFSGKVLLDSSAIVVGGQTAAESFERIFVDQDNGVGTPLISSPWDRGKHVQRLVLRAQGRQAVWELRRLLYALRGRQVSFYLPSFRPDLTAVGGLTSGDNRLDITNVGYTQFVRARQPRNVIRVVLNDGTSIVRTVDGSSVISASVEQITVTSNWPSTVALADIRRVEYVEKVRLDSDDVQIAYDQSGNRARLQTTVKSVFE